MSAGLFGAEPLSPAARRALIAGCIGFAVDFFDIYLPILALAPVTTYFQPPGLSSTVTTTIYFFIFATTLLGRPCGAVIFGHWADRIGRRQTTIVSIVGFGVCTLLIACLPGYALIGITSLVLLILLRFIGGVFMGGEYTSNNTLALEMVPKERRGFVGGVLQGAYPIGFFFVSVVTSILLSITTPAQYLLWGWRVAFAFGGILAVAGNPEERIAAEGCCVRCAPEKFGADRHYDAGILVWGAGLDQYHARGVDPAPARSEQIDD